MSLGNREDKAGSEAEPEELPDIGPFNNLRCTGLRFPGDKCVLLSQYGKTCIKYIYYSCILTSDKRNKDSLVRCFYENKFCSSMLKNYERKEEL